MQLMANNRQSFYQFSVPQAIGFNGICMNTIGTSFLNDINANECQQYITDLFVASETFLSPLTYIKNAEFGFSRGIKSTRYPVVKVDIGSVWILNSAENTLKLQKSDTAETLLGTNPTYTAGCSVTNAVKEVFYTITFGIEGQGFIIKKVTADFILQDTLDVGSDYCQKTDQATISTSGYRFAQSFEVKFVPEVPADVKG